MKKQGGANTRQLSVRNNDQLLEIKEQIISVCDKSGEASSNKVLVITTVLEICRNLFAHIGSFKFLIANKELNGKKAVEIRIILYKSDVLRLQQAQTTMPEVLGLDIEILRSVFDHVDAKIVDQKDFSITMTKYCSNNKV